MQHDDSFESVQAIARALAQVNSLPEEVETIRFGLVRYRSELFMRMPETRPQVNLIRDTIQLLSHLTELVYDPQNFPDGHTVQ